MPPLRRVVSALRSAPVACLLALAAAGCAGPAAHPALDQAHAAVDRARSSPRVRALAPAELNLAEIALEQAGAAAGARAPRAQVEHLAYVASQRAAFAEARAAAQVARSETRLLRRALGKSAIEARLADQQTRPPSRQDQQPPAPPQQDQRQLASVEDDQEVGAAEPDANAAAAETALQDIRLSLAELPFEQAEPTDEALEELAALAQRLLLEPGRSLLIAADFNRPEPEAPTVMERRVEVVRAFFLERGVAPARLIVRAGDDSPVQRQATSPFLEAPD